MSQTFSSKSAKRIESLVRKAIFTFSLIENEAPLGIALSGGKDSVTLLHMLKHLSGKGLPSFPIIALHVDGVFSCGASLDLGYLTKICQSLEVPLVVKHSTQKEETLSCYPCSRERRKLLFQAAKENGIKTIAFGHHQDDLAETLLMNLFQKGEFAGLLPKIFMQRYEVTIIRPLIYLKEEEIVKFSKEEGFARIVCRCPVGQVSQRKKVKDFLEELKEIYPHVKSNLAHASLTSGSLKANFPLEDGLGDGKLLESLPVLQNRLVE